MTPSHLQLVAGASLLALATALFGGCGSAPQVTEDEAVFKELDALYTAVTSKRADLLDACRKRMNQLHDDKRISDPGFDEVSAVMSTAAEGKWTDAAERLYAFMRAQRKRPK